MKRVDKGVVLIAITLIFFSTKTILGTSCEEPLSNLPDQTPIASDELQIANRIETLNDLLKSAHKTSETKVAQYRKNLTERASSIRRALIEEHVPITTVDLYNSTILHATFMTLKPAGWRRIHPRSVRMRALDAQTAVNLFITNVDGFTWSNLTHELGVLGRMSDIAFFTEVVPKIQNQLQF